MFTKISSKVIEKLPYVGPVVQSVGLVFDANDIIQNVTSPMNATKIIVKRFGKECLPPSVYLSGKCIMLVGGLIASCGSPNPLI